MATVAVTIAGRAYRMSCGEGEEAHLQALGRHVDATLADLRKGFGEVGDNRLVVMTAISVADELFDARRRIGELEGKVAAFSATRSESEAMRDALAAEIAGSLDAASARAGGSGADAERGREGGESRRTGARDGRALLPFARPPLVADRRDMNSGSIGMHRRWLVSTLPGHRALTTRCPEADVARGT